MKGIIFQNHIIFKNKDLNKIIHRQLLRCQEQILIILALKLHTH